METKSRIITSGEYAKSNTGNFTAKTDKGLPIFISKSMLATIGITDGVTLPTFPIFGYSMERMIGRRDASTASGFVEDSNGVQVLEARVEMTTLFSDLKAFGKVENAEFELSLEIKKMRFDAINASGLTAENLTLLAEASF